MARNDEWMPKGRCFDIDPAEADRLFFDNSHAVEAAEFCSECPVEQTCLAYALVFHQRRGVWGGRTESARRRVSVEKVEALRKAWPKLLAKAS